MIDVSAFDRAYRNLHPQPLRVEVTFDMPPVAYEALRLDGILAHTVVMRACDGHMPTLVGEWQHIPLPLATLWQSPAGVPLWASTDFGSMGSAIRDVLWVHRRALEPTHTPKTINIKAGQHKEKRTPMPISQTRMMYADCLGDPDAIADLLQDVQALGKKRGVTGGVVEWRITLIESFALVDETWRARRPIPVAALRDSNVTLTSGGETIGYAPPYWHPQTRGLCIPAGMPAVGANILCRQ